jgi:hypothetical protein
MDRKTRGDSQMAITPDRVREIFKGLENGDGAAFFEHVVDDVDWTVMGTHPLAGHYLSKKALIEGCGAPCGASDRQDQAVVELILWPRPRTACASTIDTAG